MGQVLHRSATATEAIRRAIQHSQVRTQLLAAPHRLADFGLVVHLLRSARILPT